jgi:hypothetical protein
MNIYSTDLFQYMAGDMIGQSAIALTIADVTMENMNSGKGGQQTKPCLRFKERSKLMVLNKTNAKTLAGILGPETENWKGARVTITAPVVDAFGKSARSLRITDVQPPAQIPVKTRGGHVPAAPTYADGSPVSPAALDGYRDYLAANGLPPSIKATNRYFFKKCSLCYNRCQSACQTLPQNASGGKKRRQQYVKPSQSGAQQGAKPIP